MDYELINETSYLVSNEASSQQAAYSPPNYKDLMNTTLPVISNPCVALKQKTKNEQSE
jgi:hypothetical protein